MPISHRRGCSGAVLAHIGVLNKKEDGSCWKNRRKNRSREKKRSLVEKCRKSAGFWEKCRSFGRKMIATSGKKEKNSKKKRLQLENRCVILKQRLIRQSYAFMLVKPDTLGFWSSGEFIRQAGLAAAASYHIKPASAGVTREETR